MKTATGEPILRKLNRHREWRRSVIGAVTRSASLFAIMLALHAIGSSGIEAGDRDSDRQMKQYWREQRLQELRRQREAERAAAREQERRAAQQQSQNQKANTSGAKSSNEVVTKSGTSSTTDSANKSTTKTQAVVSRQVIEEKNEPPPTIEKWLKQLSEPKSAVQPVNVPEKIKPAIEKAVTQTTATPKEALAKTVPAAAAKAVPSKAVSGGRPEPIEFPEVPLPEVLAVNASASAVARAKSLGFTTTPATSLASLDLSIIKLLPPQGMSVGEAQALLQSSVPGTSFAPNMKYRIYKTASGTETKPSGVPPTPSAESVQSCAGDRCFAQNAIGWNAELRKCASGIKVGIIDTSVDISHPAFARKKIEVHHFGSKNQRGPDWHGTGVAALLAGDAKSASPGLIPDASFYIADIFYAGEDKSPASDTLSMLRAFDWLEDKGVKIINMSLSGPPDILIQEAVAKLAEKGVVLVAAAGNDGPNNSGPSYPAAYDDVIAVTAVNKNLQNYRYANRGAFVDIAAPGVGIWTALPGSQHGYHSGTSFATPYVTASLAAIYPRLSGRRAQVALQSLTFRDLGDAGNDPVYGRGLLVAPTSCSGGQIATAPAEKPQGAQSFFGLFAPTAATPKNEAATAEELPWLSLDAAKN